MNQFFSFERFSLLVAKHWADNKKRYGLSVLAFIGILATWFLFTLLMEDEGPMESDMQFGTFLFMIFASGTLYASQYFRDFGSRARGINFLMVPASTFEKFLCSLLYTVVLFFIVFTVAFYLVDFLLVAISNSFAPTQAEKTSVINVFEVGFFTFSDQSSIIFLPIFFSVQSAFLLGSVYFRKYSFIKTVIAIFVFWFLMFFLVKLVYNGVMTGDIEDIDEVPQITILIIKILIYGTAPLLWWISYSRLKAKQV